MRGAEAFLEVLARAGVRYLFGNPGSTELPLMDALAGQQRVQYVLGLHEIPVVSMADGYAQASGQPSVANLHICCGLGNAMGMVYNAYRAGSPVVITAGQQDRRLITQEPVLWGDLVSVARPWTKFAAEVHRTEDLPALTRRALQEAVTPPRGPTFLSIPVDVQAETAQFHFEPFQHVNPCIRPPEPAIRRASRLLLESSQPCIVAGSRITEAGAHLELARVAELLGAPVYSEAIPSHGRCAFPPSHPLFAGILPMWSPEVRERLEKFDVILLAGLNVMVQYIYHEPARPLPETARSIHIDSIPGELGKSYAADVAVWGDLKTSLEELAATLQSQMTVLETEAARARLQRWAKSLEQQREALRKQAASAYETGQFEPLAVMEAVARSFPQDGVLVLEATSVRGTYMEEAGLLRDPRAYFGHRGWALGWGMGFALGVRLAWPDRPVLAIVGDGAALYGIQALWTAAHYKLPVTWLIANNREYRILKTCCEVMKLRRALAQPVGLEVHEPAIDFVTLAASFGVEARRAASPTELEELLRWAFHCERPVLLETPLVHAARPGQEYA